MTTELYSFLQLQSIVDTKNFHVINRLLTEGDLMSENFVENQSILRDDSVNITSTYRSTHRIVAALYVEWNKPIYKYRYKCQNKY